MRPASERENNFDAMRFALACLVIFSHSYPALTASNETEPFFRLSRGQMTFGDVAVDAFFLISGFLITASWIRSSSASSYFRKRVARIYPAFIVMTAACAALAPAAGEPLREVLSVRQLGKLIVCGAVLQPYANSAAFASNPIPFVFNASAWTIRFEFCFYVAVAALGFVGVIGRRKTVLWIAAIVLIGNAAASFVHLPQPQGAVGRFIGAPADWSRFAAAFFTGCAAYVWRERLSHGVRYLSCAIVLLCVAGAWGNGLRAIFPLAGGYVVYWLAFHPTWSVPHFARHGDFSYGIYLYAFPVQQMIVAWFGTSTPPWLMFLIALPISVGLGVLSWFAVERHFLRAAHSRSPAASPGSAGDAPSQSPPPPRPE